MTTAPDAFDYDAAIAGCARGDKHALRRLYEQESARLLGVALRIMRNRQAAEDVLQDAFVSIWTRAASFDTARGAGRGWIYTIVRHRALDAIRDGARETVVGDEVVESISQDNAHADMRDQFELREDLGRLRECLTRLDPPKRNSILYAYIDGFSHSEIAERLQTPLGTVKAWIKRGLNALKECMV